MAKQLIFISPPGERLTIRLGEGTVQSEPSGSGDDTTHLIVEPAEVRAAPHGGENGPPPRKPDIIMSLVGGAPSLDNGAEPPRTLRGSLALRDLSRMLDEAPEGASSVLVLGRGYGD